MEVTLSGTVNAVRLVQPLNAYPPIEVTAAGTEIPVSAEQSEKAY